MKSHLYSLLAGTLVLAQTLWLSATPALAAAPRQAINDLLEPTIVESCPGFSPFDAGVVLQEAVNSAQPIGNLLFGPLDDETLSFSVEGGMQGFCGYVSASPTTGLADKSQTHVLTTIDADHAVVARHLTLNFGTNTFPRQVIDLYALVAMVGATDPDYDNQATFTSLYNSGGYVPFPQMLYTVATGVSSFKAEWLAVEADQPYEEVLWLWQTLDDGYFSLLMARTGLEYSLVAARLGPDVNEQRVQGYSLVILDQIAAGDGTDQEATTAATAGATTESEPAALDCALLSDEDAAILVGETALAYSVTEESAYGCKYLPASTDVSTADDGSTRFRGAGALLMVVPNDFAVQSFGGMTQGVEAAGASEGEVEAIQTALEAGDFGAALQALAQVDLQTDELHITALPEVSDDAVWLRINERGERVAVFLRSLPDGQILQIMVIRPDLAEAETSEVEEINAAIGEVGVRALTAFAQTSAESPSEEAANQESTTDETAGEMSQSTALAIDCSLLSNKDAALLVGETSVVYEVADDTTTGCTYLPESSTEEVASDNVWPDFTGSGAVVRVGTNEFGLAMLADIVTWVTEDGAAEREIAPMQAAVDDGDLLAALQALAQIDLQAEFLRIEALSAVSDDAVWLHMNDEEELFSYFLHYLPDGTLLEIFVRRTDVNTTEESALEEVEATIHEVVPRVLADFAQNAGKLPAAKLDIRTFPTSLLAEPIGESTMAQTSYILARQISDEVEWYRESMAEEGWQELDEWSQVDEETATLTFAQADYKVGLLFGYATAVELRNYGNLDLATLPATDDATPQSPLTGVYLYTTKLSIAETAEFLRAAFIAAGWQDATSAEDLSYHNDDIQVYTFSQPGNKLSVQLFKGETTTVRYEAEIASDETPTNTGKDSAQTTVPPVDLLDIRTYPTLAAAEPMSGTTSAKTIYIAPQTVAEAVEFYRDLLQEQGWQEIKKSSFVGDDAANLAFAQDGYTVGLTFWRPARLNLVNYGNLELATLPVTEDATLAEQGPGSQTYTTKLGSDEAAEFLRDALNAAGWQETTTAEQTSSNNADLQSYTFVQPGHQLSLVLSKGATTTVTYQIRLVSLE